MKKGTFCFFSGKKQNVPFFSPLFILLCVLCVSAVIKIVFAVNKLGTAGIQTATAAAKRELGEETGLDLEPVDCHAAQRFPMLPAWRARYAPDVATNLEHVFRVICPQRSAVTLNPREHSEYRWLPRESAAALASSWTNREALLRFVPPFEGGHSGNRPS
jgi:8-oxo-dGTP pyrophosphatase MutT (NUDIX family)